MAAGWIIYACRTSFAVEVAEAIWRHDEEVALLVDNLEPGDGAPAAAGDPPAEIDAPVVRPTELSPEQRDLKAVVPLITPGHRFAVEAEARGLGLASFPALVDPTAVVARSATVGEGSVVNAAAVLGGETSLGRFVHVNRSASVGHHNVIEDYATLGPGCLLAGSVRIGRGAFVGAGAVCAPEVGVGPDALVGAGAVVVRDVPAEAVVVGNPARVVREGAGGYGGVTVPEATA
jgi:sugar O-acyltransferase (sialic acid O-acetyltransferase NeuD family)